MIEMAVGRDLRSENRGNASRCSSRRTLENLIMKYSTTFASIAFGLVTTACGGLTGIGQGGEASGGETASGGGQNHAGAKSAGGASSFGGAAESGGTGASGNVGASGGISGTGGAAQCETAKDCPSVGAACQECPNGSSACPTVDCKAGQCVLSFPTCSVQSCKLDSECPKSLVACELCADGSSACPWAKCIDGTCTSGIDRCAATCSAQGESCADGETCCNGLMCCAGVPVPPGNEYCGSVCPKSDQNLKRDFLSVDPNQILDKLSRLPIGTWAYRTESSTERHIGPMAQDFAAAFNVGSSDRTILQIDGDGVAFAAIQALNARLTALEEQNRQLQVELKEQAQRCQR